MPQRCHLPGWSDLTTGAAHTVRRGRLHHGPPPPQPASTRLKEITRQTDKGGAHVVGCLFCWRRLVLAAAASSIFVRYWPASFSKSLSTCSNRTSGRGLPVCGETYRADRHGHLVELVAGADAWGDWVGGDGRQRTRGRSGFLSSCANAATEMGARQRDARMTKGRRFHDELSVGGFDKATVAMRASKHEANGEWSPRRTTKAVRPQIRTCMHPVKRRTRISVSIAPRAKSARRDETKLFLKIENGRTLFARAPPDGADRSRGPRRHRHVERPWWLRAARWQTAVSGATATMAQAAIGGFFHRLKRMQRRRERAGSTRRTEHGDEAASESRLKHPPHARLFCALSAFSLGNFLQD